MSKTVVVAGGAGFLGSHLSALFLDRGDSVVAVDNFVTGFSHNVAPLLRRRGYTFVEHDIVLPFESSGEFVKAVESADVFAICNLASPASPPAYQNKPIETLRAGSEGMRNVLEFAEARGARVLQASTSEVYGDPEVHPQPESYWGRVNPTGPRSMYDEAKRFAEALCVAYERHRGVTLRLPRIFNTYGPHMDPADGRVVTNFLSQALAEKPLSIYGDGTQTRSFCYVDDEVRGLVALLDSDVSGPVNIGNPAEFTMLELAELVAELTGSPAGIEYHPLPGNDPSQRRPDISRARELLGWVPTVELREGLERTIHWMRNR